MKSLSKIQNNSREQRMILMQSLKLKSCHMKKSSLLDFLLKMSLLTLLTKMKSSKPPHLTLKPKRMHIDTNILKPSAHQTLAWSLFGPWESEMLFQLSISKLTSITEFSLLFMMLIDQPKHILLTLDSMKY